MVFVQTYEIEAVTHKEILQTFTEKIGGKLLSDDSFEYDGMKWKANWHPFDHSDDIITTVDEANKFDNFLLIKESPTRALVVGWCSKEELTSTPPRDIYRNGKMHYMVVDTNLKDLSYFKIKKTRAKDTYILNQQTADNLGAKEYIDGVLAGLHHFAKQAGVFFKDLNQKDECMLGEHKVKVFTRDAQSDEDMLVPAKYNEKHPDVSIYLTCKIKGGAYWYVGYVPKSVVDSTRVVQMIGTDSDKASKDIRRIFAEQYLPISKLLPIEEEIVEEEKITEQNYVPLHVHSEYSIGDAYGTINYLTESIRKRGFKACALTDHGTMAGVWKFQRLMIENGLKPIIGCEVYVRFPEYEKYCHQIILVKNQKGWQNLLRLQATAARDYFYYKPVIPSELMFKYNEGLIICSACASSIVNKLVADGRIEQAEAYIHKFKSIWGDDYYGEMQAHTAVDNLKTMKVLFELFTRNNVKMIFTTDSHYPYKKDKEYHEAVKAVNFKKDYGTAGYGDDCFYLMQDDDINDRLQENTDSIWMLDHIDEWKKNTVEIADKIDFKIIPPKEKDTLPKMGATPEIRKEKLKKICIEGLEKNTPYKYEGKAKEQLDLEIDRILSKDYENYFLLVADLITWAKKQGIACGPGRGSVGSSLAAYALGITDCDSLKYNLLFDRFLSEIRRDMPDVDMDFQDSRRHEVFDYLKKTYGDENWAKVATYARYHPKGVMRDIGRIFNIPINEIEKICGLVIERSGGDARASFGLMDTFAEFEEAKLFKERYPQATKIAIQLEGHIRHRGIHAAAMVITEKPIHQYAPLHKISGEMVVEFEKQEAEDMKLVKLDVLGLKTLSVIAECHKDTGVAPPKSFGHQRVYDEVFKTGKTAGVFQFETVGLSKLSRTLQIDRFNLLYDTTTLFRPGALHSGQTMQYVQTHKGERPDEPAHHLLKEITKDTKGIILYQEQIMQIMNQIGGMSWATAEMARKVITKSKGKKAFEEMRAEFVRNAGRIHSMSREDAEQLYDVVSTFGSYSFNKSHAVEYSIISYQCAWYKTFFPQAFFKAILKFESDNAKIRDYLSDAKSRGIEVEYPDINKSKISYSLFDERIFSGFNCIKGIGVKTAEKIIANQPYVSIDDFRKRCKVSEKIFHALIIADCFRGFGVNKRQLVEGVDGADFSDADWSQRILESTTLNPKMDITAAIDFGSHDFISVADLSEERDAGELRTMRGIVTAVINKDKLLRPDIKKHVHKFEYHMLYLNINDGTGNIAVQINPWTYERYKDFIADLAQKPIVVFGELSKDANKLIAHLIQPVDREHNDVDELKRIVAGSEHDVVLAATPGVSKKGNSYYRIRLQSGLSGLWFKPTDPLYAGQEVFAKMSKAPFLDLKVIK